MEGTRGEAAQSIPVPSSTPQAPGQEPSGDHPPSSPNRPGTSEGDTPQCTLDLAKQEVDDWGSIVRTVAETGFLEWVP